MKYYLMFLMVILCPCLSNQLMAQTQVHGSVQDASGKPLQYVNVFMVKATDSSLVKGTITDASGKFSFENSKNGKYRVAAVFTGMEKYYSPLFEISPEKTAINMGVLHLKYDSAQLANVTVSATRKPLFEQKIDRMVINVANSITAAGSTVLEVLERSPGVMVNQQSNSISLNGKDGVVVMINGKINRMPADAVVQMLAGMSADNIEKIELITTPPANFDAEGNAGYINIVLKTNSQYGTNGSFTLTGGYSKHEITEGSFNVNHRKNKINLYADLSYSRAHGMQEFSFYNKVANAADTTETATIANRDIVQLYYSGKLGIDYQLSKKTIIGVFISGYDDKFTNHSNNNGTNTLNHQLDSTVRIVNNETNNWYNVSGNVNLEHTISANQKIILNANYDYYNDNDPNNYLNSFYNSVGLHLNDQSLTSSKKTPINVWVETADYSNKLSKKLNLDAGLKSTLYKFQNDVEIDTIVNNSVFKNASLSGNYFLKENINAAYTSLSLEASDKTAFKAGLRYEYTNSNLSSLTQQNMVDRHYGNLFPSIFLSHTMNADNNVTLSYSRRITRPTFKDMAPFVIFFDPHTFFSGNAAIQPSIADIVSASYTFKRKIISVSYSYEANPITNFTPTIDSVTKTTTYASSNQKDQQTLSVALSLPFTVTKWWTMQNNITAIWQQLDAVILNTPFKLVNEHFNFSSTQSVTLPKNWTVELSGYYFSKSMFSIYTVSPFGSLNAGIQKKFPKNRSSIRFNVSNMLNTMSFKPTINLPSENIIGHAMFNFSYPSLKLTYSKSFGSSKVKEKRERATGDEDEKARVH